eukprot:133472-Pelagomonas_calceolata.AAC.2
MVSRTNRGALVTVSATANPAASIPNPTACMRVTASPTTSLAACMRATACTACHPEIPLYPHTREARKPFHHKALDKKGISGDSGSGRKVLPVLLVFQYSSTSTWPTSATGRPRWKMNLQQGRVQLLNLPGMLCPAIAEDWKKNISGFWQAVLRER